MESNHSGLLQFVSAHDNQLLALDTQFRIILK
jgi:hypothetical protein